MVSRYKETTHMRRTLAAKTMLASGVAALALGAAACEIEDAGIDGDLDDGGLLEEPMDDDQ